MCRGVAHGGRRCPGETGPNAERRRARQRAAYAQAKVRAAVARAPLAPEPPPAPLSVPPPVVDPHAPATALGSLAHQHREITATLPKVGDPPTAEDVAACIAAAREAVARLDAITRPATVTDAAGWTVPTRAGLEAEAAVLHAGAAVDARATAKAQAKVAAARAKISHRPGMKNQVGDLHLHENPAAYSTWVDDRLRTVLSEVGAYRGKPADEQRLLYQRHRDDVAEAKALGAERVRLLTGESAWDHAEGRAYADAYRAVLAEQRPMGGQDLTQLHEHSVSAATKRVQAALRSYPTDWAPTPDNQCGRPVAFTTVRGRAYAGTATLRHQIGSDTWDEPIFIVATSAQKSGHTPAGVADALHEYGHYAQHSRPGLDEVECVFVSRRTTDDSTGLRDPLEPLSAAAVRQRESPPLTPAALAAQKASPAEWGRPDHFVCAYAGRDYGRGKSGEVFTVGMEALFSGRYGGLVGRGRWESDGQHRALVLGALATL